MQPAQTAAFAQQKSHIEDDRKIYQEYTRTEQGDAAKKFADFERNQHRPDKNAIHSAHVRPFQRP